MLSTSAELARSALDAAPDAMIILDEDGIVRFANRQVSALFGYTHDEIIGLSVEQLMPERFRSQHVTHRRDYASAPRMRPMGRGLSLFGRRQDGGEFPAEISLSPIQDTDRVLIAAAIRDVTDRKRAEAELKAAREAADQARDSADRANQAKSRFLAAASHDLRQPLQTLALLNGTLRRMIIHENAEEALSQQEQAIGTMSRLLNTLLDISKLESGAIRPEIGDFPIASLFEVLQREFTSIAANKGLAFRIDASTACARSDPALVEQILRNLVSNAIKYTRQGRVMVRCVPQEATTLRVEVIDTGIGIPAEEIGYIYDEFYQVGVPTNSSRDGYGLGLSIVQRLVKLLNLRLEVTSEVGKGSVFALLLPLGGAQRVAFAPQAANIAGAADHRKLRVLLVEDDPGVRDATRMLLAVEGYRVTAVPSKSEALRKVGEEGTPDLLITDYHLAGGELGTDVITALRQGGAIVRAVLITGDTSTLVKQMSVDPHVRIASKPVDADELLGLLTALRASA
jgi:two-component system, sensor histidine kinase